MREASNLGQIIGRLMAAAAAAGAAEPGAECKAKPPRKLSESGLVGKIRGVLRGAAAPLNIREISKAIGTKYGELEAVTAFQVATNITKMPDVDRSGSRGSYSYAMKAPPT